MTTKWFLSSDFLRWRSAPCYFTWISFLAEKGNYQVPKRLSWYCWVDSILWFVFTKSLEVLGQGSWGHSYPYLVMGKLVPQTQSGLNYHIVRLSPTSLFLAQCGCNRLWRALGVGLLRWTAVYRTKATQVQRDQWCQHSSCSHRSCVARVESLYSFCDRNVWHSCMIYVFQIFVLIIGVKNL